MKKWSIVLFLLLAVCLGISSCNDVNVPVPDEEVMRDGEWDGLGEGRNGLIKVRILVQKGIIKSIRILSQSESVFAVDSENEMISRILANNGIEGVDAVSGATLTSNGIISAVSSAIDAAKDIDRQVENYGDSKCDVVIVGAGGAGLAAALEAASAGKKVIVLEKQGIIGGNTNSSTGGLNAAGTAQQLKLGIQDSKQLFYDDTMKGGYCLNDPILVRTLTDNASEAVKWLSDMGADLNDVGFMAGSSVARTHRPDNGVAIGPHLMSVLYNGIKHQGIELRLRNKVTGLVFEDNCVKGVNVGTSKGAYTIRAEAVILATGGFGANMAMLTSYRPELADFSTSNHSGATGDAVDWVASVGGALVQMEQIQTHPTGERTSHILISEAVRGNGAILINEDGRRFTDEMLTRDKLSEAILSQKGKHAYLFFDSALRRSLSTIEYYAQQNLLVSAESIEELTELLKLDAAVLGQTLSDYADYQRKGEDVAYGRSAGKMPLPLTEAPFYVIDIAPVIHHTMGGVKISENAAVLDSNGNVIKGLYAAGEVTGGIHGGNRLGGNAISDVIVFGRIAGREAAK